MTKKIKNHSMFTPTDYAYLSKKGYTNKEIIAMWDDAQFLGLAPLNHKEIFDIVGYLNK